MKQLPDTSLHSFTQYCMMFIYKRSIIAMDASHIAYRHIALKGTRDFFMLTSWQVIAEVVACIPPECKRSKSMCSVGWRISLVRSALLPRIQKSLELMWMTINTCLLDVSFRQPHPSQLIWPLETWSSSIDPPSSYFVLLIFLRIRRHSVHVGMPLWF